MRFCVPKDLIERVCFHGGTAAHSCQTMRITMQGFAMGRAKPRLPGNASCHVASCHVQPPRSLQWRLPSATAVQWRGSNTKDHCRELGERVSRSGSSSQVPRSLFFEIPMQGRYASTRLRPWRVATTGGLPRRGPDTSRAPDIFRASDISRAEDVSRAPDVPGLRRMGPSLPSASALRSDGPFVSMGRSPPTRGSSEGALFVGLDFSSPEGPLPSIAPSIALSVYRPLRITPA